MNSATTISIHERFTQLRIRKPNLATALDKATQTKPGPSFLNEHHVWGQESDCSEENIDLGNVEKKQTANEEYPVPQDADVNHTPNNLEQGNYYNVDIKFGKEQTANIGVEECIEESSNSVDSNVNDHSKNFGQEIDCSDQNVDLGDNNIGGNIMTMIKS